MSWRCSLRYWSFGLANYHMFVHALDPKTRRFHVICWGHHAWQIWPPRSVLDWRDEWSWSSRDDAIRAAAHAAGVAARWRE